MVINDVHIRSICITECTMYLSNHTVPVPEPVLAINTISGFEERRVLLLRRTSSVAPIK